MVKHPREPGRRVQLHRALSKLGWGSRGQAWSWIRAGEVRVDGRIERDPLAWVDLDRQRITRETPGLGAMAQPVPTLTLALHKPRGIVTTRRDERGRRIVYDLLPADLPWVFPAGRLDADSEGLLILTNDSDLSMRLTDPAHRIAKTYRVSLRGIPTPEQLDQLRNGVVLPDGPTRPASVSMVDPAPAQHGTSVLEIVLTEGRNRQVRRMCAAVGHRVRRLVRTAIGGFQLGDLPVGVYRLLDDVDWQRLTQTADAE